MYDFTFSIVLNVHSTAAFWTGDNGSLKCDTINHFFFIDFSRMRLYKGFIIVKPQTLPIIKSNKTAN